MSNLLRSNVLDQQLDLINLIFWPDFINYISTAWINQLYGLNLSNSYQQQFDAINLLYWHHQLDLIYINSLNLLTWYYQLDLVKLMLGIWFNHLYHIYINRLNYFPCVYQFAVINFIWLIDTINFFWTAMVIVFFDGMNWLLWIWVNQHDNINLIWPNLLLSTWFD